MKPTTQERKEACYAVRVNGRLMGLFLRKSHAGAFAYTMKGEHPQSTVELSIGNSTLATLGPE